MEESSDPLLAPAELLILNWLAHDSSPTGHLLSDMKERTVMGHKVGDYLPRLEEYKLITRSVDLVGDQIILITPKGCDLCKEQLARIGINSVE